MDEDAPQPEKPAEPLTAVQRIGRIGAAIWARVRSGKAWQWSAAYLVAAFAVLQGVTLIADTMGWPTVIGRVALVVLAAGFPIVAIVAWHHGDQGRQRITRTEGGLIAGCLAVATALVFVVSQPGQDDDHFTPSNLPRLAVLRFESLGATTPFFSETLADELISEVSRINGLDVIARASSFALTGARATPAAAASELRANYVLTGSVANIEGQVRVNVQLAEAPSGRQLWSQTFQRPTEQIYVLQDEIAAAVARASGLRMSERPPRRVKREAYDAYVRGREAEQADTREAHRAAKTSFETAVAADPSFAEGWAALAQASYQSAFADWQQQPANTPITDDLYAESMAAADRAIALDPSMASPYETRSRVLRLGRHWRESLQAAQAAEQRGGVSGSVVYLQLGYMNRAESLARRAVELDPLSPVQITYIGVICEATGRYDCAVESAERAYHIAPDRPAYISRYATALASAGRIEEALQLTHTRPDLWRQNLPREGILDMQLRREMLGGPGPRPNVRTMVAAFDRGETTLVQIIEILQRTGQAREIPPLLDRWRPGMPHIAIYQNSLAAIRATPQFWSLAEREGMLAVWREEGWPDFCAHEHICEAHRR